MPQPAPRAQHSFHSPTQSGQVLVLLSISSPLKIRPLKQALLAVCLALLGFGHGQGLLSTDPCRNSHSHQVGPTQHRTDISSPARLVPIGRPRGWPDVPAGVSCHVPISNHIFNQGCGGTGKDVFCWCEHSPVRFRHPPALWYPLGQIKQDSVLPPFPASEPCCPFEKVQEGCAQRKHCYQSEGL